MKRSIFVLAALATVIPMAAAQSLYNNAAGRGLLEPTGVGTEVRGGGGFNSRLQGTQSLFGLGAQLIGNPPTTNNWVADDFTVGAGGWNVTGVSLFAYQTGATAVSITGANVQIRQGSSTGAIMGTGTFTGASFANVFRMTSTAPGTDAARQLQRVNVSFANVGLGAGSYWLVWQYSGALASGPWQAPLAINGSMTVPGSQNALQSVDGQATWNTPTDAGSGLPMDLPFYIDGQPVPEPATMIALGLGAAALLRRRRKA